MRFGTHSKKLNPIGKTFPVGRKIDLAFNLGSLHPEVRSTIIQDCDYQKQSMTLAQTRPRMLPDLKYDKMQVTTLLGKPEGETIRVGVGCDILTFDSDYRLSTGGKEASFVVGYVLPLKKTNIRGAYRIRPNSNCGIMGKLLFDNKSFRSDREFRIHDISATGIGLPVPKLIHNRSNPLFHIQKGKHLECKFQLIDTVKGIQIKIRTPIKVVRNQNLTNTFTAFIGGKYSGLDPKDEENLFQFIHSAQMYEIRKMMKD